MDATPLSPAPLVYAHRGDRSRAADNTLEAFDLAVEGGADGIELDVRSTADDVLIVSHDPSHGDLPAFHSMTFEELRHADPSVPTLEETLRAVPRHVFLNVEIKNTPGDPAFDPERRNTTAALDLIAAIDDPARILLSSFDPESVAAARRHATEVLTGLLITSVVSLADGVSAASDLDVAAVHPPMSVVADASEPELRSVAEAGLAMVVWNANTPDDVSLAVSAGASVVITDDPRMAKAALATA